MTFFLFYDLISYLKISLISFYYLNKGIMSLELNQHLGKQLRARRSALGLTQTQVARAINVTFQQIQKYEKGTNGVSSSRLLQLANFLKVPVKYFFEEFKYFQNLDSQAKSDNSLETFVAKLSEVEKEKLFSILHSNKKLSKTA
jgi:transcriptional regulator with XRE-family HTH domain